MLRRIITIISIGLIAGAYADNNEKLDQIQKSLDNIMAKAGISIGGEFKSQYFGSKIGGPKADTTKRTYESNEFTSVDFDIKARPNEWVSGRILFRMHENWQNFFADVANPIFSRWISIDGTPLNMFRFNVGDFKEKYSPLTLYSPDIEILNEPYIFARERQLAMDEKFIGDNYRILQGVNLGFDAEVAPVFNEFHLGLIGSRLRSNQTNTANGDLVTSLIQTTDTMSQYLVGSNLDLTFLKGINLGGTFLYMFDHKGSFEGSDTLAKTLARQTDVVSFRPGVDIGKLVGASDALKLKLSAEVAFTSDDSTWFLDSVGVKYSYHKDSLGNTITKTSKICDFPDTTVVGKAINISANIGFTPSKIFGFDINGSFIMNDQDYRNALAQTPSFIGHRIMNVENDKKVDGTHSDHYSTFDAMYHSVFKFTPHDKTNMWERAPMMKNSYYRGIMNQKELNSLIVNNYMDPSVQLVMPFGPATPNRVGVTGDAKVDFLNNGIELSWLLSLLNEKDAEMDSLFEIPKASYSQIGGGLKIDLSKMIDGLKGPLELSTSFVSSKENRDAYANDSGLKVTSNFFNLGLYYKFYKRAALLGGLQTIQNTFSNAITDINDLKITQMHWAGGLEWKVADGASLVGTVGQIIWDDGKDNIGPDGKIDKDKDWKQWLFDVSMRVKF